MLTKQICITQISQKIAHRSINISAIVSYKDVSYKMMILSATFCLHSCSSSADLEIQQKCTKGGV